MKSVLKAALTVALVLALFAGGSHAYSAFDLSSDVDFEELQDVATIMQTQNTRGLLDYGNSPVPGAIGDAINAVQSGSTTLDELGIPYSETNSQQSVSSPPGRKLLTPPTITQMAEIANKVAAFSEIPGVDLSTKTFIGDTGSGVGTLSSITIYVYLGQAEQKLIESYSNFLAAKGAGTPGARRALLQATSSSNVIYIALGDDEPQVERYRRQLETTLRNSTTMTEISNEVIPGSTAEAEIITPSPPPPAPAPPLVCSYSGHFTISPLYSPCNKYFMAYVYPNCENTNVYLRTTRQLGNKPRRAVWRLLGGYLNGKSVSTTISAVERRRCPARNLQDTSGPSMLVASPEKQWTITPAGNGENCDQVNIFSEHKQAYLQVPSSCKSFSYANSDGGRQRFRLRQV